MASAAPPRRHTPECEEWDVIEAASAPARQCRRATAGLRAPRLPLAQPDGGRPTTTPASSTSRTPCAARSPTTWCRCCATATSPGREERVEAWVESYRQRALAAGTRQSSMPPPSCAGFDLMGLQRHLKVLGIFCRLWYRDGKAGYLEGPAAGLAIHPRRRPALSGTSRR